MNSILMKSNSSDSELTAHALEGHRDAFGQIVSRYQSLVCSLAYSATGSLSQSEDLAQETFIAAWKGLRTLREPEKLRSWLCSIARNIIANAVRRRKQEPSLAAEPLDTVEDQVSTELQPVDRVISSEEESILWRSLGHIPQLYREPLVLFYREGQSIESVAKQLELSEEAVKQRLSRGRRLLKMEVESFVENTLRQSAPGRGFTAAVLAGLPELSIPAGVASVSTAAAKGSAIAKMGFASTFLGGMLVPVLGALGGMLSAVGSIKSARSIREKSILIKTMAIFLSIFVAGQIAALQIQNGAFFVPIFMTAFGVGLLVVLTGGMRIMRLRRKIQIEEGIEPSRTKLPFYGPESRGFKWNVCGGLLGLVFCNPLAYLAILAAGARDSAALAVILIILFSIFIAGYRTIMLNPEKSWNVVRAIPIVLFPLLLIAVQLRWEAWTGRPAWQLTTEFVLIVGIGFLLFAVYLIHWLVKRNR
jgi:RNA polymerase sigma factor (sigma-70 family)